MGHTPLYLQLAREIESSVQSGLLRPGDRVPSVREQARTHAISISTVVEAYSRLESTGIIESKPQSGYFVRLNTRAAPGAMAFPAIEMSQPKRRSGFFTAGDWVADLLAVSRRKEIVALGGAVPPESTLPIQSLTRHMKNVMNESGQGHWLYETMQGFAPLRNEISKRLILAQASVDPDNVVVTDGAQEALNIALAALTKPGDTVAVESPIFYGTLQALESRGLRVLEIPSHPESGMDLDTLDSILKLRTVSAILTIPNFNNPLGSLMSEKNKERLVRIAERQMIPIIEDDVYGDLFFERKRPCSLLKFPSTTTILSVSSFSKTLAPALRVGWIVVRSGARGPITDGQHESRLIERILYQKSVLSLSSPTLAQRAIARYLKEGTFEKHLRTMRTQFAKNLLVYRGLIRARFPMDTQVSNPRGGFVLWIHVPSGPDVSELYRRAIEERLVIAPGFLFSAQNQYRRHFRINFANTPDSRTEQALTRLSRLIIND